MALLHFEGFEYAGPSDLGTLGYVNSNGTTSFGSGRRGQRGLSLGAANYNLYKNLGANYSGMVIGLAFSRSIAAAATYALMGFSDGTPANSAVQMSVRINTAGQLLVYRGTTLIGTTTFVLALNQFYYIEFKADFHGSTGSYDLRVGNVSRLSASGINTISTANAYANHFFFGGVPGHDGSGGAASVGSVYDDIYVLSTSGGLNDDFLGDCRVDGMMPDADGTYTQFTPSTGVSHYALVDEGVVNISDYNYSTTIGHKDTYNVQTPPSIPDTDVFGYKFAVNMTTDVSGSRSAKALLITNSNEFQSPTDILLNTSQKSIEVVHEVNPDTSAMWTNAELAAVQIGAVVTG